MNFKKSLLFFTFLVISFSTINAQTSDMGFSFQGYAIDPDGKALASTAITVRFTLSPGTFTEDHAISTDAFGVFTAIVGNSNAAKNLEFSKLDFTKRGTAAFYSLKVEVKKTSGGTFVTISNEPMKAVPYARHAFNGVPTGTIVAYGGPITNLPYGWLLCDGSTVSAATYPQLSAAIGTTWGGDCCKF